MTQKKLASEFGVTPQAISEWERDEGRPDLAKIAKLSRALQVPATWLLDGKGPPPALDGLAGLLEQLDADDLEMIEDMAKRLLKRRGVAA